MQSAVGLLNNQSMSTRRILVVDDELAIRDLLHDVLHRRGFEVVRAATAAEALDFAEESRFDLVILDIALEDADGLELLATFKERNQNQQVLMLTGLGFDDELTQEALEKGAAGCLSKTAPMTQLAEEVQRILDSIGN